MSDTDILMGKDGFLQLRGEIKAARKSAPRRKFLHVTRKDVLSMARDFKANPKLKEIALPIGHKRR